MDSKILDQRQAVLDRTRIKLKQYFIGLDDIIDNIIDKITAWYLFPDVLTRPLIINLWGITGVGKTDLVRKLVRELEFGDRFIELQMSGNGNSIPGWHESMRDLLLSSDIEEREPGILLLDEFQRFRTVREDGAAITDLKFQDTWMLLSDGKFGNTATAKNDIMRFIYDSLYDKEHDYDEDDDEAAPSNKTKTELKMTFWKAQRVKGMFKLKENITEIMKWDEEKIFKIAKKVVDDPNIYTELDYSKLLIFISGNLDEAFRVAVDVSEADKDATVVHERTKQINLINVKDALLRRFKPEQISRLGNIHIIYPTLSKDTYQKIISDKLDNLIDLTKNTTGITFSFTKEVKQLIYDNGVFPAQGIRPVLSTINDVFNTIVPPVVIKAARNNSRNVIIDYTKYNAIANFLDLENEQKVLVPYKGTLDIIREDQSQQIDNVCSISVHEAGHAVAYIVLFGIAPQGVSLTQTSTYSSGLTDLHATDSSIETNIKLIVCLFGGKIAEKLVFGPSKISMGCTHDMETATDIAGTIVRKMAQNEDHSSINNSVDDIQYNTRVDESNEPIARITSDAAKKCEEILINHKDLLIAISEELMNEKNVSSERLNEIANNIGVPCKLAGSSKRISIEFKKLFDEFASN